MIANHLSTWYFYDILHFYRVFTIFLLFTWLLMETNADSQPPVKLIILRYFTYLIFFLSIQYSYLHGYRYTEEAKWTCTCDILFVWYFIQPIWYFIWFTCYFQFQGKLTLIIDSQVYLPLWWWRSTVKYDIILKNSLTLIKQSRFFAFYSLF